jgi:CelD/BcsL family acetyltransferase involved in cellulose biosynthesis
LTRTFVARTVQEMQALRPAWESLEGGPECTLFQSFAWNRLAASVFAGREPLYVVYAETGGGAAIIPGALGQSGTVTLLGEALFDYRDVLAAGDEDALALAWASIAELQRPLSVLALRGRGARRRWTAFAPQPFCGAPMVGRAQVSAESFAAAHPRLGRFFRRLLRQGAGLHRYSGDASGVLRNIYWLKAEQPTPEPNLFRERARIDFLVRAAALEPANCDIFTCEAGATLVCALVTFRDRDVRRFYTGYFDARWAHYSPGMALLFEATRLSLAEGLDCDYLTGEQSHKMRLATTVVPLFQVEASAQIVAAAASRAVPQVAA